MVPETDSPVLVVVSVDPEISHRANEAVRIALGILAGENTVTVVLLGAGAKILDADVEDYVDGEDLARHLSTLKKLGQCFHVERSVMPTAGGWNPIGLTVVPIDRPDLVGLLAGSRRTLAFYAPVSHVLHLVKDPGNAVALDVIRAQAADPEVRLSVVLMQDAVSLSEAIPGEVYRLSDGHTTLPPPSPGSRPIGPTELLDLIFAADSVVTW